MERRDNVASADYAQAIQQTTLLAQMRKAPLPLLREAGPFYVAVTVGFETFSPPALARKSARFCGIGSCQITAFHAGCGQNVGSNWAGDIAGLTSGRARQSGVGWKS
ncbi:hypothetical protein ARTHRO9AX_30201 [Arthrobacter sp. 9AX]|nr:hypothetical protein ARTHRO9AX_30201 [Arthrobacter sp. 9AX]